MYTIDIVNPAQYLSAGWLEPLNACLGEPAVAMKPCCRCTRSAADTAHFRSDTQGTLWLARERAAAAREKERRMAELFSDGFVSTQARDDAPVEAKRADGELTTAEENAQLARLDLRQSMDPLNRRVLRSLFNGVVMDQYLYPDALVDPSEGKKPILRIAQTQPLSVQAMLRFRHLPQMKAGAPAMVLPDTPFGGDIAARISPVDCVIDSAAGTFGVVVVLPNVQQALPGGIRCKLRMPGLQ